MAGAYVSEGKMATLARKRFRRAVARGEASWSDRLPAGLRPQAAKPRRPFGEGILRSLPTYRLDCTLADLAWYEEQLAQEQEREIDRRFAEYQAQERLSSGWDC